VAIDQSIFDKLEKALSLLLEANPCVPIYLIDLTGEIDARFKGSWGIGIHFEDRAAAGAVRHEALFLGTDLHESGLSEELAEALKNWVIGINARLKVPRPPRIVLGLTG